MSTKMTKPVLKMMNKQIKRHIIKWANVIKLFWNKYVWKMHYELKNVQNVLYDLLWRKWILLNYKNDVLKNALWTEERSKCSWYIIENYSKNQKQSFL